jgi:hypothetical protein
VPVGEREEIAQEPTKHDTDVTMDKKKHSTPFKLCSFNILC